MSVRRAVPVAFALVWLIACEQVKDPMQPALQRGTAMSSVAVGNQFAMSDPSGMVATYSTGGALDLHNPFFQSLGTNGRSCASCHIIGNAMGLSADFVRTLFATSAGTDPLFSSVDGANCPSTPPGSGADAHSLLIGNGLIRVGITEQRVTQYTLAVAHDPYNCAVQTDSTGTTVSVYRRPLPATNLSFLTAVMFDGRETVVPLNNTATFAANLRTDLAHQVVDATLGHAQAAVAPTASQVAGIVDFELSLYSAQRSDNSAGELDAAGANGGPSPLAGQQFYPGINDPLGGNPTGAAFDPASMTIFQRWLSLSNNGKQTPARQAIARGEQVFGTHALTITGVRGLNDALGLPSLAGTCTTCHNAPNVGDHSLPLPLDIGTSHAAAYETDPNIQAALAQLSPPDLPIYQVTCGGSPVAYTTDPGKALLTGNCVDLNRIKGPILRGLAARAPYFHNGAAATLDQVVAFYNQRFQMHLTAQEQSDLVAFLKSL
jgi:cytochrome c peroxidase